ncbi:MAG: hypothetical protein J5742_04805 [Alphaproteobacteria bacterium]|nr:hypothetical protein [Alphaproteobacteria bacterium]
MSKNALIGISSLARKIAKLYVGVGGYARKVKKGYIGVGGLARVFYTGDPVLIFEQSTIGTYTQALSAGTYEITLIGGGGGASGRKCTTNSTYHYAQGGVGGTIQITAKLTSAATVTIVVGKGGATATGSFSSASGGTVTGSAGVASTVTGFTNLTLSAGGGTAGSTRATSTTGCTRTVGVIGTNTASGTALLSTLINNPNACTSSQASSTASARTGTGRENDNWPDDPTRGKSGDFGWRTNTNAMTAVAGQPGYARIRKL